MDVTPPHNEQIELELMYLMLYEPSSAAEIMAGVEDNDFYSLINRNNFSAVKRSYVETGKVDIAKVEKVYRYGEVEYVSKLFAPGLIKELKDLTKKRALVLVAELINKKVEGGSSDKIIKKAMEALMVIGGSRKQKLTLRDIVDKATYNIEKNMNKDIIGLSTGFKELDRMISGFRKTHVWVLGGYTSYGKTTVAVSMLCHLTKTYPQNRFLYCSLEMSAEQILHKIVSNLTRRTFNDYRRNFSGEVSRCFEELKHSNIELVDDLYSTESIYAKLMELEIKNRKPDVVFIDFIQNISGEGGSEYEKITKAMTELQKMAKRLNICIVVLSQVNNESANKKSETIGFKGTGAIPAVADITVQVVRDKLKELEYGNEIVDMKLIVQKNRHGQGGIVNLDFDTAKGLIINH